MPTEKQAHSSKVDQEGDLWTLPTTPASHPAVTQPAVTQPAVTQPAVTQPAVTQPAVTQSAVTAKQSATPQVAQEFLDGLFQSRSLASLPEEGLFSLPTQPAAPTPQSPVPQSPLRHLPVPQSPVPQSLAAPNADQSETVVQEPSSDPVVQKLPSAQKLSARTQASSSQASRPIEQHSQPPHVGQPQSLANRAANRATPVPFQPAENPQRADHFAPAQPIDVESTPTQIELPSDDRTSVEILIERAASHAERIVANPSNRAARTLPPAEPEREVVRQELLDLATFELSRERPEYSAVPVITKTQKLTLLTVLGVLILVGFFFTIPVLRFLVVLAMIAYSATLWLRVQLVRHAFRENKIITISDEEARAFPDHLLPRYSVLIPAYKEPEVIEHLLGSVALLEYPKHKLEVKLLLEEDDYDTIVAINAKAARGEVLPDFIEVVLVPAGLPRTKPKACNYGLKLCSGDLVTIYDAEDIPEPLQLRRAAIALLGSDDNVACVQARLEFHNHRDNLLTKWFTVEYAQWFTQLLPGLVALGGPIPLGGTSNHFKRDILDRVYAWDPFNVTEDADLGVRLQREGYSVGVVQSVTLEEANCDFVNWIKQRSRWYKGYLLSFLVHLRDPKRTYKEVGGFRPFRNFLLFVGGTPLLGALSLLMMGVSVLWSLGRFTVISELFPGWVGITAVLLAIVGNLTVIVAGLVTIRLTDKERLLGAVLLTPLYGVMMSIAATKAIIQLVTDPFHWEKTAHGLSATVQHPGPDSSSASTPGAAP